jgi:hypothetical protein
MNRTITRLTGSAFLINFHFSASPQIADPMKVGGHDRVTDAGDTHAAEERFQNQSPRGGLVTVSQRSEKL